MDESQEWMADFLAGNPQAFDRIGYCPADYTKPGIDWVMLEEGEDGWDLFGDGTFVCWRTPGHSPGHMSIEVTVGMLRPVNTASSRRDSGP